MDLNLGDYTVNLMGEIGRGSYSTVFPGKRLSDGTKVAVKRLKHGSKYSSQILHEVNILKDLDHRNIIKLYAKIEESHGFDWFIFELCDLGTLSEYLNKIDLNLNEKLSIMKQGCGALVYLHGKKIVHRDIKPNNLLFKQEAGENILKLADFNTSKQTADFSRMSTIAGTPPFMAPELFTEDPSKYTEKVDIFSLGLVYHVLNGFTKGEDMVPITADERHSNQPYGLQLQLEHRAEQTHSGLKAGKNRQINELVAKMTCFSESDRPDIHAVQQKVDELHQQVRSVLEALEADLTAVTKLADKAVGGSGASSSDVAGGVQSPLDYTVLTGKTLKCEKSVDMIEKCSRMHLIGDAVWCLTYNHGIQIYNKDCELQCSMLGVGVEDAEGFTQLLTGDRDIVVVCKYKGDEGLHQFSVSGSHQTRVAEGWFCDVCWYDHKLYALGQAERVYTLQQRGRQWEPVEDFKAGFGCNRLSVSSRGVYVSSYNNGCVYHYSHQGALLQQTGKHGSGAAGLFRYPNLCGVDPSGNLLVVDRDNHCMQLYNQDKADWSMIRVKGKLESPKDAVLDPQGKHIWTGTFTQLQKYSIHHTTGMKILTESIIHYTTNALQSFQLIDKT